MIRRCKFAYLTSSPGSFFFLIWKSNKIKITHHAAHTHLCCNIYFSCVERFFPPFLAPHRANLSNFFYYFTLARSAISQKRAAAIHHWRNNNMQCWFSFVDFSRVSIHPQFFCCWLPSVLWSVNNSCELVKRAKKINRTSKKTEISGVSDGNEGKNKKLSCVRNRHRSQLAAPRVSILACI